MFRGRYDHTIDQKGRLSIPAGFRMEIQRRSENPPVLTMDQGCLALYPFDEWERFQAELAAANRFDPKVRRLTRFFVGNAVDSPIDSQGRILIPKNLREKAGLEREASLTGMASHIQIWDSAALDHDLMLTYEDLDDLRTSVSERSN